MVLLIFFVLSHAGQTRNGYIMWYFPKSCCVLFVLAMMLILRASVQIPGGWGRETMAHGRPIVKRGQLSLIFEYRSLGKQQPHA